MKQTLSGSSSLKWLEKDEEKHVVDFFEKRFGINPDFFSPYRFYERSKAYWLISNSRWINITEHLPIESAGLMVLRRLDRGIKPTTVVLQLCSRWIKKNVIDLKEDELAVLISKKNLKLKKKVEDVSRGYVAVRVRKYVVGCCYFRENELVSQLPKSFLSILSTSG